MGVMRAGDRYLQCPYCETRGQVETALTSDDGAPAGTAARLRRALAAVRPGRVGLTAFCNRCGFIWRSADR